MKIISCNSCDKDKLIGIKNLQTRKLSWVLDRYLNDNKIDFLTVDVEGMDFEVLKSNNWNKYRPKVIIIEFFTDSIENILNSKINSFLNEKGYLFYCCTPTNVFFIENNYYNNRFNNK